MYRIWLSGISVFLGALLLFVVQPLAARSLLPWYGGAPMVWAVALFFFQAVLLGGYLYAHLLVTRFPPRIQVAVHAVVLGLAGVFCLPPIPGPDWAPAGGETPAGWILLTLLITLGPAFFALAATTPLISAWLARAGGPGADEGAKSDVYRFYALSNAGSLIGLASYPLLLEPVLGLAGQAQLWSGGFLLLALLTILAGFLTARTSVSELGPASQDPQGFHVSAFLLAAVGTLALVAVTTHLTRDVAAVPFLWIAPLAIYLLTFILAFRGGNPYPRRVLPPLLLVSVAACFFVWFQDITYGLDSALARSRRCGALLPVHRLLDRPRGDRAEEARSVPAHGLLSVDDGGRSSRGARGVARESAALPERLGVSARPRPRGRGCLPCRQAVRGERPRSSVEAGSGGNSRNRHRDQRARAPASALRHQELLRGRPGDGGLPGHPGMAPRHVARRDRARFPVVRSRTPERAHPLLLRGDRGSRRC